MPTAPTQAPPPAPPKASAPPKAPPPAPPPPSPAANGKTAAPVSSKKFGVKAGVQAAFQRVVLFGSGGIGKSELAANMRGVGLRPLFLDIGTGTGFLDVERVEPAPTTWDDVRAALHEPSLWQGFNAVVLDDLTAAETLAIEWTLQNVQADRSGGAVKVSSIEGYGWGKGYVHVYETFLQLLGDLDMHVRAGRQVVCIAHECTAKVPNPAGEDFIRYEPRLQNADKGNIRARVKEWTDHLLYVGYDVFSKDGKARGGGSRTVYPVEMPTHVAKSRSLASPLVYERGSCELWKQLFGK